MPKISKLEKAYNATIEYFESTDSKTYELADLLPKERIEKAKEKKQERISQKSNPAQITRNQRIIDMWDSFASIYTSGIDLENAIRLTEKEMKKKGYEKIEKYKSTHNNDNKYTIKDLKESFSDLYGAFMDLEDNLEQLKSNNNNGNKSRIRLPKNNYIRF
jgi:hypothetical protein